MRAFVLVAGRRENGIKKSIPPALHCCTQCISYDFNCLFGQSQLVRAAGTAAATSTGVWRCCMGRDWFPKRTIGSLVDERDTRDGSREALVFEGRRWTFAELARDVDAVARGLIALGIAPRDKVSLWMMNRPEWICAALAVMRIGAVLVPKDAAYVLGQSDSSTLIVAARS